MMHQLSPSCLFLNGRIYTQWPAMPWAEALAVAGGRVLALGSTRELCAAFPTAPTADLGGQFVMPGLHDAHIHFYDWALSRQRVALWGARSLDEMIARIRTHLGATAAGRWITGQGWVETEWQPATMPTATDLDVLGDAHPMLFHRTDLHGALANRAALRLAGVTRDTPDPVGGVIARDGSGEPTGLLFEMAINLVARHIPEPTEREVEQAIRVAIPAAHALGLTAIHDQRMKGHGEGAAAWRSYARLRAEGVLSLRVTTNVDAEQRAEAVALGLHSGLGDATLQVGHMKLFVDGSLGSRTAWMLEPFEGQPDNRGVVVTPVEELRRTVAEAQAAGFAISVHAIGDRANREMLDIFEELAPQRDPRVAMPHRIEHVQLIHPDDLPRLARLGIIASVQPIHATDDWIAVERHWGKRGANAYAFRRLLDSGATLALGSDAPVADPNPFAGIYAAISRQRADGTPVGGFYPTERLTVEEAIHGYTVGAAAAVGRDSELGRLAPGYYADFIVLDRHPFDEAPGRWLGTEVVRTVVGGDVVWEGAASS